MNIKVGFGFDVHKLEAAYPLFLGGIEIPSEKGAVGHSDADVLIHAICDALLGAANLNDIGTHFPDTDPKLKGIDSKVLLAEVCKMVRNEGFLISNIDSTVSLQKPKIISFVPAMKEILAKVTDLDISDVSIKATTTEKLGFTGREEGVAAYCVVLIRKK